MSGILWVVLGLVIGLLTPILVLRRRRGMAEAGATGRTREGPGSPRIAPSRTQGPQARSQAPGGLKHKLARKFHGVSVKPGKQQCAAVQALAGRRFLPEDAPAMPLAACDQQQCQCSYSHHASRRDEEDRRSGWGTYGGFTPAVPGGNRRGKGRDRRSRA